MKPASSLVALVVRRIVFFAALAMVVQFLGVFAEYWSDDQKLGRLAIEMETKALSHGVSIQQHKLAFDLPAALHERYANASRGYYVRFGQLPAPSSFPIATRIARRISCRSTSSR